MPAAFIVFGVAILQTPARGFSPEAESVLEHLREGIASGSAGEEAYTAFLDRIATGDAGDGGDCRAWLAMPEAQSGALRFTGLREALAEVCPAPASAGRELAPDPAEGAGVGETETPARPESRKAARTRISVSQSVHPRRDPAPSGWDRLAGEGALAGGAWQIAFREGARPDQRLLRLGSGRFSFFAGQFHGSLEGTRLGFVTGGRFYAGRSGTSGVAGPWESRSSALDGLAVSARAGRWMAEAAGAWNRLNPRAGEADPGPDVLLYQLGLALPARIEQPNSLSRHGRGGGLAGWGLRLQIVHLRGEGGLPDRHALDGLSVAGLGLEGVWGAFACWNLGLAASRIEAPSGLRAGSGFGKAGGYAEAALSSPHHSPNSSSSPIASDSSRLRDAGSGPDPESEPNFPGGSASWRLEARQATEAWANPLQSPRGSLRDTVGGWMLPGRGEGATAARGYFPFATRGAWVLAVRSGLEAVWSSGGGLLAQSGSLALIQRWGAWTAETGTSLQWRGTGTASSAEGAALSGGAAFANDPGGRSAMALMGWGQNLVWRMGVWKAKAAFAWKGEGYDGAFPAPLSLEAGRSGDSRKNDGAWSAALLTGDVRNPGDYLRAYVRETWRLGKKLKAEQAIRIPLTPEGLGAELSYQLRLEAAL
ncbi:MAG: hypothetical protein ABIW76_01025 [Fibrobacteria bacterium]